METPLKISNLTVSYPSGFGKDKVILNDLNLDIKNAEIFGLLGPNGAGKTTLIKSIAGLINIKKGDISIFGKVHTSMHAKSRMGYMPEIANYYWFMTPREILRMFGRMSGMDKALLKKRISSGRYRVLRYYINCRIIS